MSGTTNGTLDLSTLEVFQEPQEEVQHEQEDQTHTGHARPVQTPDQNRGEQGQKQGEGDLKLEPGMLIFTPQAILSPTKNPAPTQPISSTQATNPTPAPYAPAQLDQMSQLAATVHKLVDEVQLLKSQLNRPSEVAASSVVTDALSSLSDKLEHVSVKIQGHNNYVALIKANLPFFAWPLRKSVQERT
jgi:hypothetical protein